MHAPDFFSRRDEELVVNITSLIDVIFILLIFFMVSTQFKRSSLPLDLPKIPHKSTIPQKYLL